MVIQRHKIFLARVFRTKEFKGVVIQDAGFAKREMGGITWNEDA